METATEQRVRNALRQLEAVRANVLGFVLNRDRSVAPVVYGYLDGQMDDLRIYDGVGHDIPPPLRTDLLREMAAALTRADAAGQK